MCLVPKHSSSLFDNAVKMLCPNERASALLVQDYRRTLPNLSYLFLGFHVVFYSFEIFHDRKCIIDSTDIPKTSDF